MFDVVGTTFRSGLPQVSLTSLVCPERFSGHFRLDQVLQRVLRDPGQHVLQPPYPAARGKHFLNGYDIIRLGHRGPPRGLLENLAEVLMMARPMSVLHKPTTRRDAYSELK